MTTTVQAGQTVILKLTTGEVICGEFRSRRKQCITLSNVQDFETKRPMVARATLFYHEITNIGLPADNGAIHEVELNAEGPELTFLRRRELKKKQQQQLRAHDQSLLNVGDKISRMTEFFKVLDDGDSDSSSVESEASSSKDATLEENVDSDFVLAERETKLLKKEGEIKDEEKTSQPVDKSKVVQFSRKDLLKFSAAAKATPIPSSNTRNDVARRRKAENAMLCKEFAQTIDFNTNEDSRRVALRSVEFERIKDIARKHWHVKEMGGECPFRAAINRLANREIIAIVGIGCERGRKSTLTALVMASWEHVYFFDLIMLHSKQLWTELRIVLESPRTRKVVYDGRALVDCLYHKYEIDLANVFDVVVADKWVERRQNGGELTRVRPFHECVALYLNVPVQLFEKAEKSRVEADWVSRPLKERQRIDAALLVAPLISLRNKLERKMLSNFYRVASVHRDSLKRLPVDEWPKNLKDLPDLP